MVTDVLSAQRRAQLQGMEGMCSATAARRAARYLSAAADRVLTPSGLKIGQFSQLHAIALHGPISIGSLAERMATDRTTLATNLKPLERDGLVQIESSVADQRVRNVSATARGIERLFDAVELWERAQKEFEESFGAERAAAMRAELRSVLVSGLDPW